MKLTDNCINDFQVWAISHEELKFKNILGLFCINLYGFWIPFYLLPDVIKYGIFVDFFDSVDIDVMVRHKINRYISFSAPFLKGEKHFFIDEHLTRQQAREQAILKANEIYNSK